MKRCEFLDLNRIIQEEQKPVLNKSEDNALPGFSTDVPKASEVKIENDLVKINYAWASIYTNSPFLRATYLVFNKGQELDSLFRLRVRDGVDTIVLKLGNSVYLLRKTTEEIAQALLSVNKLIVESAEQIIGYIKTLAGNVYVISKIAAGTWAFDSQLVENNDALQYVDSGSLSDFQKQKLCELVQERLIALHGKKLVLSNFTLHNILFTQDSLLLTDLRDLRAVRKTSLLVEDFRRAFGYLVTAGIAKRADVYHAVITYAVAMEHACEQWYHERKGSKPKDSLAIVGELEQALYI